MGSGCGKVVPAVQSTVESTAGTVTSFTTETLEVAAKSAAKQEASLAKWLQRCRQQASQRFSREDPETSKWRETMQLIASESDQMSLNDFTETRSLFELLDSKFHDKLGGSHGCSLAPVALLDGEWLLSHAAKVRAIADDRDACKALALPRRQDLELSHPEAFMSAATLASLPRGDERIGEPLPLVCVSHCKRSSLPHTYSHYSSSAFPTEALCVHDRLAW